MSGLLDYWTSESMEGSIILLVPDFGNSESAKDLLPFKEILETEYYCMVSILDLRQRVINEHPDETLEEREIIAFASEYLKTTISPGRLYLDEKGEQLLYSPLKFTEPETITTTASTHMTPVGRMTIRSSTSNRPSTRKPDVTVVFGRSAMLTDGITETPLLFINPEINPEGPWQKQHDAYMEAMRNYCRSYHELKSPYELAKQLYDCPVNPFNHQPFPRIAFRTDGKEAGDFPYPSLRFGMRDPELNDPKQFAETIREFRWELMDLPNLEMERLLKVPAHSNKSLPLVIPFRKPVSLNGMSAVALEIAPENHQEATEKSKENHERIARTGVWFEGRETLVPLTCIEDRNDLMVLFDTLYGAVKDIPHKKRIMMVLENNGEKYDSAVKYIFDCLSPRDLDVRITTMDSHPNVNYASKDFDLIVTFGTGCNLASDIAAKPRIFINPEWGCICDPSSIRQIIRYDRHTPAEGWFTPDKSDTFLMKDHLYRFPSVRFPDDIDLSTPGGLETLANDIHRFLDKKQNT